MFGQKPGGDLQIVGNLLFCCSHQLIYGMIGGSGLRVYKILIVSFSIRISAQPLFVGAGSFQLFQPVDQKLIGRSEVFFQGSLIASTKAFSFLVTQIRERV